MEIIYPVGSDASNINVTSQKRLLQTIQGQTQASPTSGYIDPSLRNKTGGIRIPTKEDTEATLGTPATAAANVPFTRVTEEKEGVTGNAFTYEGSLTPGLCLVKTTGENYAIAGGLTGEVVQGLLGQWVGGTFDGIKNQNAISCWQGPDSYYRLLAPGFNPAKLSTEVSTKNAKGEPVYLTSGFDGRLCVANSAVTKNNAIHVAEVIEYNPSVLTFKLLV